MSSAKMVRSHIEMRMVDRYCRTNVSMTSCSLAQPMCKERERLAGSEEGPTVELKPTSLMVPIKSMFYKAASIISRLAQTAKEIYMVKRGQ
jgi:hypothetical protein